jgi:hypothetical protein
MATKRALMDHAVRGKTAQPTVKHVIGPCGDRLTLADLPLPDTKRWVIRPRRKSLRQCAVVYCLWTRPVAATR